MRQNPKWTHLRVYVLFGWIFATKTKSVWSSGLRGKKEKLTMLGVKIWPPTCSEFLVFLTDLVRQNSASGTKFTLLWKQVSSTSFHLSLSCQCHYSTITLFLKQREGINSFNTIYNDKKVLSQNTKNTICHYLFANPGSFSEQLTLGSL